MKVGADFVALTRTDGVALSTTSFEKAGALAGITCRKRLGSVSSASRMASTNLERKAY